MYDMHQFAKNIWIVDENIKADQMNLFQVIYFLISFIGWFISKYIANGRVKKIHTSFNHDGFFYNFNLHDIAQKEDFKLLLK